MKTLLRQDIPKDFIYYRTGSKVFYEYYRELTKIHALRISENSYEFIKAWQIYQGVYSVIAEKIDREPSPEFLRTFGIMHGIIFWTPRRITVKPKWWMRMPTFFTKNSLHSSRSAFCVLDRQDYWMKWSSAARWHRKKILDNIQKWMIRIEKNIDPHKFLEVYLSLDLPDPNKRYIASWCEKKFHQSMENFRIYLIFVDDRPLAWGVFIDDGVTSEYFTSFYHRDGYPYHLGIAMMDIWFLDSYEKWVKYCDLDHMRDSWQSWGYKWYTKFKEGIADYDVYFHDMWAKFF